jgi:hypothetical protein
LASTTRSGVESQQRNCAAELALVRLRLEKQPIHDPYKRQVLYCLIGAGDL